MMLNTKSNNSAVVSKIASSKSQNGVAIVEERNDQGMNEIEDELFSLLNLDPRKPDSKEIFKLNERALLVMARLHRSAFRKMYTIKGYWIDPAKKSYPLKAVCALGASLSTIKTVYELYPDAAFDALCECSFSKFPLSVVEFLVESRPSALDQVDNNGRTVLHYSSTCNSVSKDVIKYIVSKNEARLLTKTTKGSTPLHLACGHLLSLKNIRLFIDREGAVLKAENNEGRTPLYVACCEKTPLDVIKYLIECCPTALEMPDMDGYVPLHGACCSNELSMDLIELLVSKNVSTLTTKAVQGGNGRTPLHVAAAEMERAELVTFLAEKNPSMLVEPDGEGQTPIHVACAFSDLDTVKVLLKLKPETLQMKSNLDYTPFVEAVVAENMPVVLHMTETYPSLLVVKGHELGWYPLHYACFEGKKESLKFLLEKHPNAAKEVDKQGRTPLALVAKRDDCDTVTIHSLVACHYDTMKIVDFNGNPPLTHDQKDALIAFFLENR